MYGMMSPMVSPLQRGTSKAWYQCKATGSLVESQSNPTVACSVRQSEDGRIRGSQASVAVTSSASTGQQQKHRPETGTLSCSCHLHTPRCRSRSPHHKNGFWTCCSARLTSTSLSPSILNK